MAPNRDPGRTKVAILEAAEKLITEKGFRALTLDEVAVGAGISKGGLLHHFSSKQALILGLAEHMIALADQEIQQNVEQDPATPGAFTRAYLRANLACDDDCTQVCATLTAESRNIPGMLELFQSYSAHCQQQLENDGLDPAIASIVRYAAEGLRSASKSGISRPSNYDQIVSHLLALAGARRSPRTTTNLSHGKPVRN